ncbi:MAG TPA: N-acetylmuramoyl-L-alanine amidase-like domain-containing protein, partial [Longimicrobiales bacterium]
PRYMIPEKNITDVAARIRNGDVIAATSSVKGLDVAHTGLAFWRNGQLHLMHAPLIGDSVEISENPLAERVVFIQRQDGIMVARPREPK